MTFTEILLRWKNSLLTTIHNSNKKSLTSLAIVVVLTVSIWFFGAQINWDGFFPLSSAEKRIYVILCLVLIWLLKWLMFDYVSLDFNSSKDPQAKIILQALQKQMQTLSSFVSCNSIMRNGYKLPLSDLPWVLILGPTNAGKTSLLCNSNINFILKPQWYTKQSQPNKNTKMLSTWLTRETNYIDTPGSFFSQAPAQNILTSSHAFRFVLKLIKKYRGKNGLNGIIITLPYAQIMGDVKNFQRLQQNLFTRLQELQQTFSHPIYCYLIISKCDLIPGFKEFFAELSNEEAFQPWGINTSSVNNSNLATIFTERFNALIKKLNQQLLTRLHHEKNPFAKPLIKDFPLQLERLKETFSDLIKKFKNQTNFHIQGIYLTSAVQPINIAQTIPADNVSNDTSLQILQEPINRTRSYFVRHLFMHSFSVSKTLANKNKSHVWTKRLSYATAGLFIIACTLFLMKDFNKGIDNSYNLQSTINDYQATILSSRNDTELLQNTTIFLDVLQQNLTNKHSYTLDIAKLLHFYSQKSQQQAAYIYQQALKNTLLLATKNYFENYLQRSRGKHNAEIYAVLQAYLMLTDHKHFESSIVLKTFQTISPKAMQPELYQHLLEHLQKALLIWQPLEVNRQLVAELRAYFLNLSRLDLSFIILNNLNNNSELIPTHIATITNKGPALITQANVSHVARMFTAKAFSNIIANEVINAAKQANAGNWILGEERENASIAAALTEQLRISYINHYIDTWENLITKIKLAPLTNLQETKAMVAEFVSDHSPLLNLLTVIHENTYFEPIVSSSDVLQPLGRLLDPHQSTRNLLYQIFSSLQALNQYLHPVTTAENPLKAAFETVALRMQDNTGKDPITQLRAVAEQSPQPIKLWLNTIANNAWQFLMQDAARYIDTSWQNQVSQIYKIEIANRYPFAVNSKREVELQKFADFFGKPGIIVDFYQNYLQAFIDVSDQNWRWKKVDNLKLPFSEQSLHKIQQALQIHQIFFPNDSNKPYVKFALKPYKLSKGIQSISLNINDKQILDESSSKPSTHLILWPATQKASVEIKFENYKTINREYSGDWAWFKLINQAFESALTKKGMLLNLSKNQFPAHYILFSNRNFNPFLAMNLRYFALPATLMDQKIKREIDL